MAQRLSHCAGDQVARIGEAAHPVSPCAAISMGMAIGDARAAVARMRDTHFDNTGNLQKTITKDHLADAEKDVAAAQRFARQPVMKDCHAKTYC